MGRVILNNSSLEKSKKFKNNKKILPFKDKIMITQIKEIQQFGIFQNFQWNDNPDLKLFNKKNIIYGWNYAGKTTLSRIFSSIEQKAIHPKYQQAKFKVIIDGAEFNEANLHLIPTKISVFNAEYIQRNLKWDNNEALDAIAFDIGENIEIRKNITKNIQIIDNINGSNTQHGRKDKYKSLQANFNAFENTKFTEESRHIKNDIFDSAIEFTKSHLKRILVEIKENIEENFINDDEEVNALKKLAIAKNDKAIIPLVNYNLQYLELHKKTDELLLSIPPKEEVIDILEQNKTLYSWAKDGYEIHAKEDLHTCSFCGNEISDERFTKLINYFSNQSGILRNSILALKSEINQEILSIKAIKLPKSKNDLIERHQIDFEKKIEKLKLIQQRYIDALNHLITDLENKENGNIFNSITSTKNNDEIQSIYSLWETSFNTIIQDHNGFISNFEEEQTQARNRLKKHLIADFLIRENYIIIEKQNLFASKCLQKFTAIVSKLLTENTQLETQLKSIAAGQEELNKFIKAFLSREDISIEVTSDDKFILKRGVVRADNLSEGEKTAISFAYFLTTLESLHRENKLIETTVFIDDPISSLDSNHIAHIYSLINSFFFRKGENPDNLEQVVECFEQLFISTHNFEFFSFLKDSSQINKKIPQKNPISWCEYYFIKRLRIDNSVILPLPKSLKLKSEYIYLFDILYKFHEDGCPMESEYAILIPNALRRFFEMYTLIKIPDSEGEIDSRLTILMGSQHNLKVLHHFSHFTTFEKLTRHDELLMVLPQAMSELMELLSHDSIHYDALKRAIRK